MIPQRLALRNFMCYRDAAPLDFAGIRLACIAGDNGHGKSALLDAITWALWGRARAKTDDELIHLNQTEMEVEFQFLLGDTSYRVIRKRSKAKGGQTILELQVQDDTGFRALTGNTVRETERKIIDLLRMDYETFINSTLLLQGRADEFTVKPPGERKAILSNILGLSLYDELEGRAREHTRFQEERVRGLGEALRELDAELARGPEYEAALQRVAAEVASLAERLRDSEERLRGLQDEKTRLDIKARQAADLRLRLQRTEQELTEARRSLAERQHRLADYDSLLAQAPEIERGHAELLAVRQEADAQGKKLAFLVRLQEAKVKLDQAIAAERHALDSRRQVLSTQIAERQVRATQASAMAQKLATVRDRLAALNQVQQEREAGRESLLSLSNQLAGLRTANDQLKADMKTLERKMGELADVSHCPLCATPLSPERRESVRGQYEAEGHEKGDSYRANQSQMRSLEQEMARLKAELAQAETALQDLPGLQRQEAGLEQALSQAEQAAGEMVSLREALADLEAHLAAEGYAPEERQKLAGILRQMEATSYDQRAHEALQQQVSSLTPFELRKTQLDAARRYVDEERAAVARHQGQVARYQQSLAEDRGRLEALDSELVGLDDLARRLWEQQATVTGLRAADSRARLELGAAQQRLAACRQQAEVRKEKAAQEAQARLERSIYEELAAAFGKKGLQALLIEEALPEVQEEANALLARMTDNRLHVRFDTQREARKGGTVETLDIKIADELGTRNYETYSGGEAFRINFAIRVALSKLVAHRAGARLQTLILDEGFGTQDAQGRERLVEAINSIRDDFQMILAITHIQELKDAFPVHIEVTKTPEGSQISIA